MGGTSLPQAFVITVRAENSLIQVGKITPLPPMPNFPNIQPNMPLQIPPFHTLPVVSSQEIIALGPS